MGARRDDKALLERHRSLSKDARWKRLWRCQVFSQDRSGQWFAVRNRAQALNEWREAARLVSTRWATFLQAEPQGRTFAFASYIAALDAEEAAAAQVAAVLTTVAA